MRLACCHIFDIEADSYEQGMERLKSLKSKIDHASTRLGIGYIPGHIVGQPQPDNAPPMPVACPDEPERLFDEGER